MVSCVVIFLALVAVDAGTSDVSPLCYQTRLAQVDDITNLLQLDAKVAKASATATASSASPSPSMKAAVAEFIAMTCFVIIGCGSAMALKDEPGWLLQVSLAFGLAITCLAYTIGHISGGQINCAVTVGLAIVGNIT